MKYSAGIELDKSEKIVRSVNYVKSTKKPFFHSSRSKNLQKTLTLTHEHNSK